MLKSFFITLIVLSASNQTYAQNLEDWFGEYTYSETPVKANADYSMVMEWKIFIGYGKGMNLATIEVNGQQTDLNIQCIVEGNDEQVTLKFSEPVYGCCIESLQLGDVLLKLTKTKEGIVTTWDKLSPRLVETTEKECSCFGKID